MSTLRFVVSRNRRVISWSGVSVGSSRLRAVQALSAGAAAARPSQPSTRTASEDDPSTDPLNNPWRTSCLLTKQPPHQPEARPLRAVCQAAAANHVGIRANYFVGDGAPAQATDNRDRARKRR